MNLDFLKAAAIRALRTLCQTAVATIGSTALLSEVDWAMVASASVLAAIISLLTSIATGLPEVENLKGSQVGPEADRDGSIKD